MTDQQSDSEPSFDSQTEQQAYYGKLQNLSSYLKQLTLYVALFLKQGEIREPTRSIMINFDKYTEEYNQYYLRRRAKRLIFFKIDPLALNTTEEIFVERVAVGSRDENNSSYHNSNLYNQNNQGTLPNHSQSNRSCYFVKMVYQKDHETLYYRLHLEMWRQEQSITTTNKVLNRFERNMMQNMFEYLYDQGYVSHIQGSAVILKSKRPNHKNPNKIHNQNFDVIELIKSKAEASLKQMTKILSQQKACQYCEKFLIYDSKEHMMMPPTCIIVVSKEGEKCKLFHENCSLKFMKPSQLRIDSHPQRQAHSHQAQQMQQKQQQQQQQKYPNA